MMKYILSILLLTLYTSVNAQLEKPDIFLSQIEMTPTGGQAYNEFYWLNSNGASLTKLSVNFPTTGVYRFDVSAMATAGTSIVSISIDGVSKGTFSVSSTAIAIYSVVSSSITNGPHDIAITLTNFNSAANHCRVGLFYATRSALTVPYVYPALTNIPLPTSGYIRAIDFGSEKLRGFSLGSNNINANDAIAMKATGANIGRCFVEVERLSGDTYTLKAGELTKLDSAVARATRIGYYLVPSLFLDPTFNTDIWGATASGIARRLSIQNLWVTLATRYAANTKIAAYDLWNEPRSNPNYAEAIRWQESMVAAIRAVDANHTIIIECINNKMWAMMLPLGYANIVYSPHGYSPLEITHQGIPGEGTTRNKYPTITNTADLIAPFGRTQLSAQHDNVRIMSRRFNVPIFIGEFSAINWSPLNDAGAWTSTEWTNENISLVEAEHWSWVYHAWREYEGWDAEIPSSFYLPYTYTNAKPSGFTSSQQRAARTSSAPTITMLRGWFGLSGSCP